MVNVHLLAYLTVFVSLVPLVASQRSQPRPSNKSEFSYELTSVYDSTACGGKRMHSFRIDLQGLAYRSGNFLWVFADQKKSWVVVKSEEDTNFVPQHAISSTTDVEIGAFTNSSSGSSSRYTAQLEATIPSSGVFTLSWRILADDYQVDYFLIKDGVEQKLARLPFMKIPEFDIQPYPTRPLYFVAVLEYWKLMSGKSIITCYV